MTETIPTSNEELVSVWGVFVADELRRLGRVRFNAEDMIQSVFLGLFKSQVVQKFWEGVKERSHPFTVSATDAARMLGLTWEDFLRHQKVAEGGEEWLQPRNQYGDQPVGVETLSTSYFRFAEVVALSATVVFPNQGELWLPEPKAPTVAQWRKYLAVSIRNASANVTRTWSRRASREHAPDRFRRFRDLETHEVRFEDNLVDDGPVRTVDSTLAASMMIKANPWLKQRTDTEGRNFFDLLKDGLTIKEALKILEPTLQQRRRLATHLKGVFLL